MSSLVSGNSNLLSSQILISGTSTLITQTSSLPIGSYTATYQAIDSSNKIGYNYRLLSISTPPTNNAFLWLDPSNASTITLLNGNISSINGLTNNITMIPYDNTNSQLLSNQFNNMPGINLNGTGIISSNEYTNSSNYTIAMIIKCNNNGNWVNAFGFMPPFTYDSALQVRLAGLTFEVNGVAFYNLTSNINYLFVITGTNSIINVTITNLNNNTIVFNVSVPTERNTTIYNNSKFFIGRYQPNYFMNNITIGEVLYWQSVLSSSDLSYITNYLINKWKN